MHGLVLWQLPRNREGQEGQKQRQQRQLRVVISCVRAPFFQLLILFFCCTCASSYCLQRSGGTRTRATTRSSSPLSLSLLSSTHLAAQDNNINDNNNDNQQLEIAFVTGNEMKAKELQMILAEHGTTTTATDDNSNNTTTDNSNSSMLVKLKVLKVDLPEIQEVDTQAIAKSKALLASQLAGGPCVVEDTSLQFTALGNMPGPYIKWFQESLGSSGLWNILTAYQDKTAVAVCTLAFCPYPHADPVLFTGVTRGTIVEPVEGRGFGWDSIFVPDSESDTGTSTADGNNDGSSNNSNKPFSCMSTLEKNQLSHRGKAVREWADWLTLNRDELLERQSGRPSIGHKGLDFKSTFAEE